MKFCVMQQTFTSFTSHGGRGRVIKSSFVPISEDLMTEMGRPGWTKVSDWFENEQEALEEAGRLNDAKSVMES